jgi:hypothetical protein
MAANLKRSTIEQRLNDAMRRRTEAQSDEWHLDGQIRYHDEEATRLRKRRQQHRAKKDRADRAIIELTTQLTRLT